MDAIKVLIEIPEGSSVKYEVDEATNDLVVDRLLPTAMKYPVNYGSIQETLGEDGDALDAIVFTSQPLVPKVVINCQVIGLLEMEDEEGIDHKIVAVPLSKVDFICGAWRSLDDVPPGNKTQIRHFFEHYKDLEAGKWVKLKDWRSEEEAEKILSQARKRYTLGR